MSVDQYATNAQGIITSPGKFEGEPHYVAAFWEYTWDAREDEINYDALDRPCYIFVITAEDVELFPALAGTDQLWLWEDDQGFVLHKLVPEAQ